MNKIIINIDDFGLGRGINQAVFDLHQRGVVNSTTALVNSPYFAEGIEQAKQFPRLGVGIHLTIDLFKAELYHPSLCNDNLNFFTAKTHDPRRSLDCEIVYRELKAQIDKFIAISGVKPTHIDSHHHLHIYNYDFRLATERLATEYQLPVRGFVTDNYNAVCNEEFYGELISNLVLETAITDLMKQSSKYKDLMVHPGFMDEYLNSISSYNLQRQVEYEILASDRMQRFIANNNILISNYRD